MFDEIVVPVAAIAAAIFLLVALVKGGLLGGLIAMTIIAGIRFAYAFIRWIGW